MMIIPPTLRRRSRRTRRKRAAGPPAALTLVAASASFEDVPTVAMQFDRAIDVAGIDVSAIGLGTQITGAQYAGFGTATLLDATTVQVPLQAVGAYAGAGTQLDAGAGSGIVAANDGGTWAGVSGVALPFP